jgi:hypothetical protein
MRIIFLLAAAALVTWHAEATAQTPVYEYKVDTSIYQITRSYFCPAPNAVGLMRDPQNWSTGVPELEFFAGAIALDAYHKKNSNQYDIFSFTGKIASVTIPMDGWGNIFFSQYFVDNDADWECIYNYYPDSIRLFKVFDANGTTLLSDTGFANYGYDWQNTYIVRTATPQWSFKAWRFRTNVSSGTPGGLAKTAGSSPQAMMTFGPTGDYRISLAPVSGGKTSVTLTDMLGRRVFSREVGNLTGPVSFTIPDNEVPPTPFVTKAKDERGTVVKKAIPRR